MNSECEIKPRNSSFDKIRDSKKSRFIAEIEERFDDIERECAISEQSESTHSQPEGKLDDLSTEINT